MATKTTDTDTLPKPGLLNIYKHRWIYLALTLLMVLPGLYFMVGNILDPEIRSPIRLGIDFQGGSMLEYGFAKPITQQDTAAIKAVFERHDYAGAVVQIQEPRTGINKAADAQTQTDAVAEDAETSAGSGTSADTATTEIADSPADVEAADSVTSASDISTIVSVRTKQLEGHDDVAILKDLRSEFGDITLLQKNSIGPAMASELLSNGLLALVLAYVLIAGYITFRFQFDFAICALVGLLPSTLFVFGAFAMFGQLFHTEVDSLFITAVLTSVGFCVHDTIVVFDRTRENHRLYFTKKVPFVDIVNISVNQTMARSINTSLTTLLPLVALYLWGGETTRDFVLAIILGVSAGTYSSIFFSSVVLAMWRQRTNPGGPSPAASA